MQQDDRRLLRISCFLDVQCHAPESGIPNHSEVWPLLSAVMRLVLVAGVPAAGKTTLARRVGGDLGFPVLTKDTIKEAIADVVGNSAAAGHAAVGALHAVAGELLGAGVGVVVEQPFIRGLSERDLAPLVAGVPTVLIHCTLPVEVASRRYHDRAGRHPVHRDAERIEAMDWARYAPMDLDVPTLLVDTSDGYRPSYGQIVHFARIGQ